MHNLICPVCNEALRLNGSKKSLQCNQSHLFDIAKQGYANLLLSQNKKSKQPGDTPQMVQARTAFLDKGYYQGIAEKLESITQRYTENIKLRTYCDLACGEGYYTNRLHQSLIESQSSTSTCPPITTGIDISSPAIRAACRRDKTIQWLIASTARIPLSSDSQDLVSGLFFHFNLAEIQRILRPGGILILANTGPNHLIELRNAVYDDIKPEKDINIVNNSGALTHIKKESLHHRISLTRTEEILQLLSMTPHYWRAKPVKKAALSELNKLDLTIDIQFDIFIKHEHASSSS